MTDINHSIKINAPKNRVFDAITTLEGLSSWWTRTEGACGVGSELRFHFGEHVVKMQVDESTDGERVAWTIGESNPDWLGTQVTFDVAEDDGKVLLRFGHRNWSHAGDFLAHCSMKWAVFLLSLKAYLEDGKGTPFPTEVAV